MKNRLTSFKLSFALLFIFLSSSAAQIRIMPLGDSITWGITYLPGVSTDEGYRGFLFDSLSTAGYNFDFVGGLQNGDSLTDKDHDGHPAWYANKSSSCGGACVGPGIAAAVDSFLTENPADIVLLHIGTNDLILMDSNPLTNTIPGLVNDIELIISNIHNFDSDIVIIVALIVNSSHNANITSLTTQLNNALSASLTESNTLRIVNLESALNYPADIVTDDGSSHSVHPKVSGYKKIADVWFEELKNVIDNILPVELTSFSATEIKNGIELKWNTANEVNNYGFEIHRSINSFDQWKNLGFIQGHGNSNSPKSYSFLDNNLASNKSVYYRLKQIDNDGQFEYSDIIEVNLAPNQFSLKQNYPNPFNPSTMIEYIISEESFVELSVFNSLGQNVKILVNDYQAPGNYKVPFNGDGLSSGVYLYKINAGSFSDYKKLVLLK
jgi:GDSL-like lipase/acylhydrolase family protein/type IX secretion system substrate protein